MTTWVLIIYLAGNVMAFDMPTRADCLDAFAVWLSADHGAVLACTPEERNA